MKLGVLYNTILSSETKEIEEDLMDTAVDIKRSLEESGNKVFLIKADKNLFQNLKKNKIQFVFNICERFNDNCIFEPHVAALLELSETPFTGSDYSTLFLCNDKIKSKEMLTLHKIPTPKYQVFHSGNKKLYPKIRFPLIVKPKQQENSIGITKDSIVYDEKNLRKRVRYVIKKFDQEAIAEEFIEGDDIEVSVIGNENDSFFLPIAKVGYGKLKKILKHKIFCYKSKWDTQSENYGDYIKADLDKKIEEKLKKIAIKCYRIFKIKDYGRVDFRLTKYKKPYVIEVTANPGMSKVSSTPESAEWIGISYKELINKIFKTALKRYKLVD